jgi:hypothetical protein
MNIQPRTAEQILHRFANPPGVVTPPQEAMIPAQSPVQVVTPPAPVALPAKSKRKSIVLGAEEAVRQAAGRLKKAGSAEDEKKPLFVDLAPYMEGTLAQEVPTIAPTFSGKALFYAGRLNEIHAEPSTGKTNVLVAASISVLESGGSVIYIDPEDNPTGMANKLRFFGASLQAVKERFHYLHNPTRDEIVLAQAFARANKIDLIPIDGLAQLMSDQGLNEDVAGDVLEFFKTNTLPFAEAGSAVVIADHVTKSREGRNGFARGSGAKKGRYDGVSYEVDMVKPYAPGVDGFVKLIVRKDRVGGIGPMGVVAAELHFLHSAHERTLPVFREPEQKSDAPFRPTAIMQNIVDFLRDKPNGADLTAIRSVKGKTETIATAVSLLEAEGVIKITRKPGHPTIHTLNKNTTL